MSIDCVQSIIDQRQSIKHYTMIMIIMTTTTVISRIEYWHETSFDY